jgi:ABC-type polysaccharide/polyol phosphate export permease
MNSLPLVHLWKIKSTVFYLALMNIKIRFKGTVLGFVWSGLEPLLTFLLLLVVFTSIRGTDDPNFAIYLLSGVFMYHIFARGTLGGLGSIVNNLGLIQSINLNKEIFPVSHTLSVTLLTIIEMGVFLMLLPFFNFIPSWNIVLLIFPVILLLGLILGLSYFLSVIYVRIKDAQILWTIFIQALFFVSPIFWYLSEVEGILTEIHKINPLGQIIELTHGVVFGNIPSLNDWLYSLGMVSVIILIGYFTFQKYQKNIIEVA